MKTVDINGKRFRSLSQAAKYIGISTSRLSELLRNKKEFMFNNFRIQEIPKPKKPKPKSKYCKVLQVNTGKIFNTISQASRYAGVDSWTMSVKMETAGSFIDKNGNEYKRLSPMITKNKYANTGKTIKTEHVVKEIEKNNDNCIEEKTIKFADYPACVQKLIEKEIVRMIENESWDNVKKFMKESGCKQLTIRIKDE